MYLIEAEKACKEAGVEYDEDDTPKELEKKLTKVPCHVSNVMIVWNPNKEAYVVSTLNYSPDHFVRTDRVVEVRDKKGKLEETIELDGYNTKSYVREVVKNSEDALDGNWNGKKFVFYCYKDKSDY